MPLTKLQFKPGINRESTAYSNEGGWFDCNRVRFRFGFVEKIGGWIKKSTIALLGTCRALINFVALDGSTFTGAGTHLKYYLDYGSEYKDITPIRETTAAGDVTFAATAGSTTITVTDVAHGAKINDFVTFSGAVSLGGDISADILNAEHQVVTVPTDDSYTITVSTEAVAGDTGNGGSSVVGEYQINTGLDKSVTGTGWGASFWSRLGWSEPASLTDAFNILRLWSHDNFGEDLIINVRDGGIYYWDKSTSYDPVVRAIELKDVSLNTDATTPTVAKKVMVSDIDSHVLCFGTNPYTISDTGVLGVGDQDPLLIRWSDNQDPFSWFPSASNSAGDLTIGAGSEIITALQTRQQILVWTDTTLHSMQNLGPPYYFGIQQIASTTTIVSPNAAVAIEDSVFWMGLTDFFIYTGSVQSIPCTVRDYVFNDFNFEQKEKVISGANTSYNEVWWFYPSSSSDENDRYVFYDYQQQVWAYGELSRTAWIDRGIIDNPVAADTQFLYLQESGVDDGSTFPASELGAFVESSPIDLQDGDQFAYISKIIPDIAFRASTAESPQVTMTVKVGDYPGDDYHDSNSASVIKTASLPVEQYTDKIDVRLRGRTFAFRVESSQLGVEWRLGTPRLQIRPDGRR